MVLAFYYMWYSPKRWKEATYTPLEPYNSLEVKTLRRHCKEAKYAGIDGFIISFWGIHQLKNIELASKVFDRCGLKYTVYIEVGSSAKDVINQIDKVLKNFGKRKGFLRIKGKPVIFIYGRVINSLSIFQLDSISKHFKDVILFADGRGMTINIIFKNMHMYIYLENDPEYYKNYCKYVLGLCALPASPGFKMKSRKEPYVPRDGGKFYEMSLMNIMGTDADILLITSFNEWWEGTNIEPSKEFGYKYLKLTKKWSETFKSSRPKYKKRISFKVKKFNLKGVCFLPNPMDYTPFMFYEYRILKKPERIKDCKLLIYAGDERYDTLWDRYILDFLKDGGKMLITGGPFPFFRHINSKAVNHAHKFGLDIKVVDDRYLRRSGVRTYLVRGKRRKKVFIWGENRIRPIMNPDEKFYELEACYLLKCERFSVVGRVKGIYYIWKGLVDSPDGPRIVEEVLRRIMEK